MTKKLTSQIKKTKARIIATVTAGGIIAISVLGLNAFKEYRPNNNQIDSTTTTGHKVVETTTSTTSATTTTGFTFPTTTEETTFDRDPHPVVSEPDIVTSTTETTPYHTTPAETTTAITETVETPYVEPSIETTTEYTTTSTTTSTTRRPETTETTMTYVTEPPIEVEDIEEQLGVEFVDVLAKLTNEVKEHIRSTSKSEPTISVTGIETMKIDSTSGIITSNLQITTNAGKSYYAVVQFSNNNQNFEIYNITTDITKDEFLTNLDEFLSDADTSCTSFKAQSRFQIKNEETISNILKSRIKVSNISSQEVDHLKSVLKNPSEATLLVSLKKSTKINDKYQYEFSAMLNTGKYCLILDASLTSNYKLTENTLRQEFENLDFGNFDISSLPTLLIHETMYVINDRANELEQGLTK